ncbi:NUDIX domain-containing protein [Paenibacillus sp. J5C_2022]|uniref:NUDIX domain-containing protein n=1 Tax=Paenibacillus sp. J5C2022 TaxID=2977129 RepID=UPI0021CF6E66|nr:NUDIX domain-containing protein [Paenibacillus sp. J5C2022]MCU6713193.1 NUDIX domain-containing protein [Paenibacillus sp. J5C2022]
MKPIRNSAKAIIIDECQILLTKNKDHEGFFYLFPGGGQEKGEELKDTLVRECIEELGYRVSVKDIIFIREYIGKNHEHAEWDHEVHQVEFYFECSINNKSDLHKATNPDEVQVGIEWVEINNLDSIRIYPRGLVNQLMNDIRRPCYIGDSN